MKRDRVLQASPLALTAPARRSGRLSEGALVEASVRARLLGIPLLRVEAAVVLTPRANARSHAAVSPDGLAEAVRSINEGADVLAAVRRNGRR